LLKAKKEKEEEKRRNILRSQRTYLIPFDAVFPGIKVDFVGKNVFVITFVTFATFCIFYMWM